MEEVQPHHGEVSRGVAGFRLYVSLIAIEEFDGNGSNTSAEVETCGLGSLELVAPRVQGYRIK